MTTSYHVVDSPLGAEEAEFFESFHGVLEKVAEHGLSLELSDRRESASQICLRYSDAETKLNISIWDDYIGETRYLEVSSEDEALHDLAVEMLTARLPILENAEIVKCAQREMMANPKILYKVAYSAPAKYESDNFDLIIDALESDAPQLRMAAATAAGLLGWPQFKPQLEEARDDEEPGEVKLAMAKALAAFK
jgi:hypothetical protein